MWLDYRGPVLPGRLALLDRVVIVVCVCPLPLYRGNGSYGGMG